MQGRLGGEEIHYEFSSHTDIHHYELSSLVLKIII